MKRLGTFVYILQYCWTSTAPGFNKMTFRGSAKWRRLSFKTRTKITQ